MIRNDPSEKLPITERPSVSKSPPKIKIDEKELYQNNLFLYINDKAYKVSIDEETMNECFVIKFNDKINIIIK